MRPRCFAVVIALVGCAPGGEVDLSPTARCSGFGVVARDDAPDRYDNYQAWRAGLVAQPWSLELDGSGVDLLALLETLDVAWVQEQDGQLIHGEQPDFDGGCTERWLAVDTLALPSLMAATVDHGACSVWSEPDSDGVSWRAHCSISPSWSGIEAMEPATIAALVEHGLSGFESSALLLIVEGQDASGSAALHLDPDGTRLPAVELAAGTVLIPGLGG